MVNSVTKKKKKEEEEIPVLQILKHFQIQEVYLQICKHRSEDIYDKMTTPLKYNLKYTNKNEMYV